MRSRRSQAGIAAAAQVVTRTVKVRAAKRNGAKIRAAISVTSA